MVSQRDSNYTFPPRSQDFLKTIFILQADSRTLSCLRFSSRFWDLGILPHISNVQKSVSKVRDREALSHHQSHHPKKEVRKCSSSQSSSLTATVRGRRASDGLEYQDDEEEEDEDDEPLHDLTGGGALLSVQPPAATAAPRLHNALRECAIRMPRGKAANTAARGPITPATGPGQASTRFCTVHPPHGFLRYTQTSERNLLHRVCAHCAYCEQCACSRYLVRTYA